MAKELVICAICKPRGWEVKEAGNMEFDQMYVCRCYNYRLTGMIFHSAKWKIIIFAKLTADS